jgi:putative ABC transport system ATP-binding protein
LLIGNKIYKRKQKKQDKITFTTMIITLQKLNIPFLPILDSDIWNKHVSFKAGNKYHIKASSGSGKSTLIQSLYGIQKNYTGDVLFNQKNIKQFSVEETCEWRATKISIVFQDLKLFEIKTALENIDIKRALTNTYPISKMTEFAERLCVAHTLNRPIQTLSYGERQRIAIIRALMQPFTTLLLDEPFSHLDQQNIELATQLIAQELQLRNATLLLTDLEDDNHFEYHQKFAL